VEHRGNAPRRTCLQGMSAPLCVPRSVDRFGRNWWTERDSNPRLPLARRLLSLLSYRPSWGSELVSSQPLRGFGAALSPDQLSERIGAGGGNRNRVFGVALRGLTFQLHPHGGKRRESNLLPQRDCGYGAATAPAVLMGASRNLTSGLSVRLGRGAAKVGGELRVRTSVLADPSVFETDCRPLQRRSPRMSASPRTRTWTQSLMRGQLCRLS
jgi:hypothetical protein